MQPVIKSRQDLSSARRVVIKAGTSVVSTPEGYASLSRIANIVENAAKLVRSGKEVMVVTSGAVGVGRQRLRKQSFFRQSMSDLLSHREPISTAAVPQSSGKVSYNSACAAAGQLELMTLYETMFSQWDIPTSQLLVTAFDFTSPERCNNIQHVISQLLALGIVPILNENDAVSANQGYQLFGNTFSDNDSLAALISIEMKAHLTILLTDVEGVYDRPPKESGAALIDVYCRAKSFEEGEKSLQGRGGMGAKVDAAIRAVDGGVLAAVITSGSNFAAIDQILAGEKVGTLFLADDGESVSAAASPAATTASEEAVGAEKSSLGSRDDEVVHMAQQARAGGRVVRQLSATTRKEILLSLAQELDDSRDELLAVNEAEVQEGAQSGLSGQLLQRLQLTAGKIDSLTDGIRTIAEDEDHIGQKLARTELADGLILDKIACPIGCLLVIFESRPECLPQIAALALKSGNAVILKGGKEAQLTNSFLHALIQKVLARFEVPGECVSLVTRAAIPALLRLDSCIDLVIPRGSSELVAYIKANTSIPVMGHAEGVCHVYVDSEASSTTAVAVVVDSKTNYPSACNAAETILLHKDCVESGLADKLLRSLRSAGVAVFGGPNAGKVGLTDRLATGFRVEYGDLAVTVEVVDSVEEAITHINTYGSGHTECIVTDNATTAEAFLAGVDSACVFHNASTRFADGYRFGLGAEVGISTGRIHARGPVGVTGLLTYRWQLRSTASAGHTVASFSSSGSTPASNVYTHRKLVVQSEA